MNKDKEIYVTRSSLPELDVYINEIRDIWDSHILTNMGPKHQKLENLLIKYLNATNLQLFTNGHMAIELSLQALDLQGEIITTPFTFASTTHAIVRNNCKPVFCDIDPDNFTIDTSKIENLITKNTVAILPVHVYGNICDVYEIDRIAKKYNLKVVYDAAHAFGERLNGVNVSNFGDVSCFSFHATKVFNTIEGGAATFSEKWIGEKLYELKNFGIKDEVNIDGVGANAKMNEFCAAMGLCNLRYINSNILDRKTIFERYCENLKDIKGIYLNYINDDIESNYSYFPVLINKEIFGASRDEIVLYLKKHNVYARKYFFPLTSCFNCYVDKYSYESTPIAYKISNNILTLPLYADLNIDEVDRICELLINLKEKRHA